jgi:hypothetical protein
MIMRKMDSPGRYTFLETTGPSYVTHNWKTKEKRGSMYAHRNNSGVPSLPY